MTEKADLLRRLAISHRLQLEGTDWQVAAYKTCRPGADSEDDIARLEAEPDPGCECATCKDFDWAGQR